MIRPIAAIAAISLLTTTALALGPHEVALIVNANSAESLKIARKYAELRSIPDANVITLDTIPFPAPIAISPEDFNSKIFGPASRALHKNGSSNQVMAWAYSTGFPTTISTTPAMSLTGITFLRGEVPADLDMVARARYESPIFAGPATPNAIPRYSRTFDRLKSIYGKDMPLPSFLLGFTGERGNTAEEALDCLSRGVSADYSAPSGTVYFATSEDVRSKAREWQFQSAAEALRSLGVNAQVGSPEGRKDIIGLLMGAAQVDTKGVGQLLPGAFADHLTSFAAVFTSDDQTKCTAWITAGATASAGTVAEPYAAWPKFPHARLFVHYVSGCTLIESFYLSLRCPLQILPIGDPLCQPWALKPNIHLEGVPAEASLPFTCKATVTYEQPTLSASTQWFIDNTFAGDGDGLSVDTSKLTEGAHQLRVVALLRGSVRSQGFTLREFVVSRK